MKSVSDWKLLNVRAWQCGVGLDGKSRRNIMKEDL